MSKRRVAVIDLETDPFVYGRLPRPFAAGFYDGTRYASFWGPDCLKQLCAFLEPLPPLLIYAHNGGKFDFLYLLESGALQNPIKVINGRLAESRMGRHALRDSYSILPIPLALWSKENIDYRWFESEIRETHKAAILDYLRADCVSLFELVSGFVAKYGRGLTMAGTAIRECAKVHTVPRTGQYHDRQFRPFYFGGRCEAFEKGVLTDDWQVLDVNSLYPHCMARYSHPATQEYRCSSTLRLEAPDLCFAVIDATSAGALPVRTKQGLSFPHGRGRFFATVHELRVGVARGLLRVHECLAAWYCSQMQDFGAWIDGLAAEKVAAELAGDKAGRLHAKLLMNSAYGKFAQNPAEYHDYSIRYPQKEPPPPIEKGWTMYADHGAIEVWRKPAPIRPNGYFDVAIAASITGAARACLLDALSRSVRAIYCDTDSIIARACDVETHPTKIGAWKVESTADIACVAGKKVYALQKKGEWVKWACKGVGDVPPQDIFDIARGNVYGYSRAAPSLSIRGAAFVDRTVKST